MLEYAVTVTLKLVPAVAVAGTLVNVKWLTATTLKVLLDALESVGVLLPMVRV